jgi:LPS-assembly protein
MGLGVFYKRFVFGVACLLTGPLGLALALPVWAAPPPIGYVGPVPSATPISSTVPAPAATPVSAAPVAATPPLGYTGPVSRQTFSSSSSPPPSSLPSPASSPSKPPLPPYADEIPSAHTGETLISAQQMHSDAATGIITASGKVEIVRGDYVLHADKVTYNQKTGVMTADGHVALLTPSGEVEFANHEQVTGDMKQAFAENIGILFPDNSRMAGVMGQRYDERYTVLDKAMYTACNVCRKDPDHPPLWQLKADSITHDNVEHQLYYHNATIDLAGVPVIYTPYVSAPDPTVERRQGFLSPQPGYSPNVGEFVKVPYYVDIAPDKDMTLTPDFNTTDKAQFDAQYRERFATGKLQLEGSITRADLINDNGIDEGQQWRGHVFGDFLYDLNDDWRAGSDVQYVTDKSYLERYQISSLDQATTRAYLENFQGRDYTVFNSYAFQDLRAGPDATEPYVLPSVRYSALGDPGQTLGGRWSFDGNTLITTRDNTGQSLTQQGPDTRRLSTNAGWERQLISDTGLETTVSGLFRTDSYWANNVINPDTNDVYKKALFTRQFEQGNAVMRYPMGRAGDGYQQLLEPIVAVTAAPDVRQIAEQPNEESLDVEYDETNLFSPNRFTGSDLIEGGSRVTYGVRNSVTADSGGHIDIFGGESYDFTTNSDFPEESGLNGHASDYVGRVDFSPADWFNANYGFRLAQSNLSPERQDATVMFGEPIFRPSITYLEAYETDITTGLLDRVDQVSIGFSSKFAKYWTLSGAHTQGFDPQPGPRNSSLTLAYVDECFAAGVTAENNETDRVDISSGTSVVFHIYLKNLGGTGTDSTANVTFPTEFRQTEQ